MENKQVAMMKGLVRGAESIEQDSNRTTPGGKIWDDSTRIGLELAREHGWGADKIGTIPIGPETEFQRELEQLINKHSQENGSNTPDYILASYLKGCLDNFNLHTRERDRWWGNRSALGPANDFPSAPTSQESLLR